MEKAQPQETAADNLYYIFGDDQLFDNIANAKDPSDVRAEVKEKLREIGVGRKIKTILLTKWADKNGTFYLAYLQGDALVVFDSLYRDDIKGCNSIQPRCICNYRYDCDNPIWERNKLSFLEKRAEYLFGYCYSDKYRCIGEYDYYGDYGTVTKIPLYRRRYWYV